MSRSTDYLSKTLSVESKKLLSQYQKNLAISRGVNEPNLDKPMKSLILEYGWKRSELVDEMKYLEHLVDPDGFLFSRNLKIFSTTTKSFLKMTRPWYPVHIWTNTFQDAKAELIREFSNWRLKPLTFTCDDDVKDALPKLNTHSGFMWVETGHKYKGENIEGIYDTFKSECDIIKAGNHCGHPVLMGFRTQASGEYEDDGSRTETCKHKLRLVFMVDLRIIVRELMFSKPMQNRMAQWKWYAGGKNHLDIQTRISDMKSKYPYFISADWSAFDQSIHKKLLEEAFDVCKHAFIMNEEQEILWDEMVYQFIHKDIVLDDGVLTIDKIIQSGSMWTQIIGSVVDLLVCLTYLNSINVKRRDFICMSDDILFYTERQIDIHQMATYMKFNFDMDLSEDGKTNCNDSHAAPKFLSIYWRNDGQYRHPYQLLSRLLYPERYRKYAEDWKDNFDNDHVYPAHVLYAYILTYPAGMRELIDVDRFLNDYDISRNFVDNVVDSRFLPGVMAYIKEYTMAS